MLGATFLLLAASAPGAVYSGKADAVNLDGVFWENGHGRAYTHIVLGLGQSQQHLLSGDRVLEATRSLNGDVSLRLLAPDGKVLHAASLGDGGKDRTFRLALCEGGGIEFSSPAIKAEPNCSVPKRSAS